MSVCWDIAKMAKLVNVERVSEIYKSSVISLLPRSMKP